MGRGDRNGRMKHLPLRGFWLPILLLCVSAAVASPAQARVAVIVNSENPVTSVSRSELKRIYLNDIRRWDFASDSKNLVEVVYYEGKEVKGFYQKVTGLSRMRLRTHWLGVVFRGERPELPTSVKSQEKMIAHVAANPNSIGFVDAAGLDPLPADIKILKIDSKAPNDEGYLFQ